MVKLVGEGAPAALNRLAREETKTRLLADILMDQSICELEGWDQLGYLKELHALIAGFDPCEVPNAR